MLEFRLLLETLKAESIANRFSPTDQSVWLSLCRSYSKAFHTPLHEVVKLDPQFVIGNVFDNQAADLETDEFSKLEEIMDMLKGIEDPDYDAKKEKEAREYDRQAEREEAERIAAGRAVHPSLQKALDRAMAEKKEKSAETTLPETGPKGGNANLSGLNPNEET